MNEEKEEKLIHVSKYKSEQLVTFVLIPDNPWFSKNSYSYTYDNDIL